MANRSLNKVMLIGNLTRDPDLKYTPNGTAVCNLGLATNRGWLSKTGEKQEKASFHRLVAWGKLAEICSQFLFKGKQIYVEGRLETRQWQEEDGHQRQTTEVVLSEMIMLGSSRQSSDEIGENIKEGQKADTSKSKKEIVKTEKNKEVESKEESVKAEDIPF